MRGRAAGGAEQPLALVALRAQADRQGDEQHHEPDDGKEDECHTH